MKIKVYATETVFEEFIVEANDLAEAVEKIENGEYESVEITASEDFNVLEAEEIQ